MRRLITEAQWASIRTSWEFDSDEPSDETAARRAGERLSFVPPQTSGIAKRRAKDARNANPWERRGSLTGIVQAAQRRADSLVTADGETRKDEKERREKIAQMAQAAREESEALRAEVIARHRQEWSVVIHLRNAAALARKQDLRSAIEQAKLTKAIAEITKLQQEGERKAWGLDMTVDADAIRDMTDAELERIVRGKL